ncbi:MAG: hypothetical protein ACLUSP_01500 [Christensenellales bacterium]
MLNRTFETKGLYKLLYGQKKSEISTEIEKSIAVVCDRGFAEDVYNNVVIEYNGKKIKLSELVTAAYFSDGEKYQIGNNPTKEDPIIKFYSKISTLRDFIIDDNGKSLIGCVFRTNRFGIIAANLVYQTEKA